MPAIPRMGLVQWRTGLLFGGFAMAGAYGGGLLAAFIHPTVLLLSFAGLMAVAGVAMMRPRKDCAADPDRKLPMGLIMVEGLAVGGVTGLVGAGGGFLVVPALVLLGGMGMRSAVGTSLLVIALKSFAGLAGHLNHTAIDMQLALAVSAVAAIGILLGASLAGQLRPASLRRAFGVLILLAAGAMLAQEASAEPTPIAGKQANVSDASAALSD